LEKHFGIHELVGSAAPKVYGVLDAGSFCKDFFGPSKQAMRTQQQNTTKSEVMIMPSEVGVDTHDEKIVPSVKLFSMQFIAVSDVFVFQQCLLTGRI